MYNKIYRSMLLLCGLSISLLFIITCLVCYTTFKSNAIKDFDTHSDSICALVNGADDFEQIIEKLNNENTPYNYTIIKSSQSFECNKFHHCSSFKISEDAILHISLSHIDMYAPLYTLFVFLLIIGALLYFLSVRIAAALTDSVVRPFSDMLKPDSDEMYAEILPLTRAIEYKNEEIKRQTENAQARKVELQLITDNMNEGLVLLNKKGNILSINNFALKVFNTDEHDVRQKHFSVLIQNQAFITAVEKALNSERSNALVELGESDYRVYCSPVLKNDALDGVIILLFDITSTYQSEKLRREFSANVSHELKTPLTSINGYAQIISNGLANEADIPEFAGKIAKESNRLMMLIDDIIRLSNLDEGAPSEPDSVISIKEIVLDTLSSLQEKADRRNIAMTCEGADFCITANKTQVSELIYNICDNAIKYNKDNGSVTVTLSENELTVSDTGIGIPNEYLPRIFERFFRVDKSHSKKVNGTGLGLSIVKHIAKQNNIQIDVQSKQGEGSKFIIKFNKG